MPVRILVADDHEIVLKGIRMILQGRPGWEICGEASNGAEAIRMAQELRPDIIIMDITMPVTNGLVATREIAKVGVKAPVLLFTMHESKGLIESAKEVGGRGIVFKSNAARDLVEAVEALLAGGGYFRTISSETSADKKSGSTSPAVNTRMHKSAMRLV